MLGWVLLRIRGRSMQPLLEDGDYAVARRAGGPGGPKSADLRPGDVVVVDHPRLGRIVKRLHALRADGSFELRGTSAASTASVDMGPVPPSSLVGRVVLRVAPGGMTRVPRGELASHSCQPESPG